MRKQIILDHIKDIKCPLKNPPIKNLHTLGYLPSGIHHLAKIVREQEIKNHKDGLVFHALGNDPMICNAFDWFVISTTNLVRIVGLVELMTINTWNTKDIAKKENHKIIKNHCDKYVNDVIPNVNKWRNKITAHPTATYPKEEDNVATIEHSLMNLINYQKPYYQVGNLKWSTGGIQSELPAWALTQVFEEKLIPRFWPDKSLKEIK